MSKFLLASDDRIRHIEKPLTTGELRDILWVISNVDHDHPLNKLKIKFSIPRLHLTEVFVRGNCCLLTMVGKRPHETPHSKSISTSAEMWHVIPYDRNLNIFHYVHDLSVVRPVLSASMVDSLHFELGGPVEHRFKIIKGQHSE